MIQTSPQHGKELVLDRFNVLKAMNTIVKSINDEMAYYNIWIYVIPDECSEEELFEIAQDDEETFNDAVNAFFRIMQDKDFRSLYVGDKVYPR